MDESFVFSVDYDSGNPGVFTYRYQSTGTTDDGQSASVGIQGLDGNGAGLQSVQYSFEQPGIGPGLVVVCDTNAGTCVRDDGLSGHGG